MYLQNLTKLTIKLKKKLYLIGNSESVTLKIFKWQLQDNVAEVIEPQVHQSFIFTMIVHKYRLYTNMMNGIISMTKYFYKPALSMSLGKRCLFDYLMLFY